MARNAYVTLVTNEDYADAATALVRSLMRTGTQAPVIIMHTGGVSADHLAASVALGAVLQHVALLDTSDAFNTRHQRDRLHGAAPFTKGNKPPFHTPLDNFAKLRLWEMEEYDNLVFLDADTLVVRNIDRLFAYPEYCAAPNVYEGLGDFHRLNSGVFTAKPSKQTFAHMLSMLDQPDVFWRRTDQTFLETFFPDWHGLPVMFNMLQYVWFNMPSLWDWRSIHVVHYQYEKPWQDDHPKADKLQPLIDLWWAYRDGENIPETDKLANPVS
ncbi:MAG: glycosyltransferase [Pseudomonadota bacterium]